MSTRSRARAASSTAKPVSTSAETRRHSMSQPEKENKHRSVRGKPKDQGISKGRRGSATLRAKVFCTCRKPDNGSPMIQCAVCDDWYHLSCVRLDERTAEDISSYVCPACIVESGLRTTRDWEGQDALEEAREPVAHSSGQTSIIDKSTQSAPEEAMADPESASSDGESSGDEYVAEMQQRHGKRRTRPLQLPDDDDDDEGPRTVQSTTSQTPPPPAQKRKSQPETAPPAAKRKRSQSDSNEDPTRKYCLSKLEEVFVKIFLKYPYTPGADGVGQVEKRSEELTPEEKEQVTEAAHTFAVQLEESMYDLYSELDKQGRKAALGKYKERFRMLQFNISKEDRVKLHRWISGGSLSPGELSTMTSTELANEEMKESIKAAEQKALEYSILKQQMLAPRAKITHKGFEDIEDINGNLVRVDARAEELELQQERQRERMARMRLMKAHERSPPSESPVTPVQPAFPTPSPVVQAPSQMLPHPDTNTVASSPFISLQGPALPLFARAPVEEEPAPAEGEMKLADLINIEDDPTDTAIPGDSSSVTPFVDTTLTIDTSNTPLSPFASLDNARPTSSQRPSFNLDTLWSKAPPPVLPSVTEQDEGGVGAEQQAVPDPSDGALVDHTDFDMFMGEHKEDKDSASEEMDITPPSSPNQESFDARPSVWSGKLSMPLDSTIPQDTPVLARQVGGTAFPSDSSVWQTLFPTPELRVEGRVPVDKSAEFLLQIRMNPSKELIAAALSPAEETGADETFKALCDFLVSKSRHGLIFPWGSRPKDHHPGKELYVVPLRAGEAIPEFIDVLDNMTLPKTRTADCMVAIWILNKGKLKPATPPGSTPVPAAPPLPPPPVLGNIKSEAIAAEVASLSQEQIQAMLKALANPNSVFGSQVASNPQHPHPAPALPGNQHAWAPLSIGYNHHSPYPDAPPHGDAHPPYHGPPGQYGSGMSSPPGPGPGPGYYDTEADFGGYHGRGYDGGYGGGSGNYHDRPHRGGRGRGRGKGRGRGRGGYGHGNAEGDHGWGKRGGGKGGENFAHDRWY